MVRYSGRGGEEEEEEEKEEKEVAVHDGAMRGAERGDVDDDVFSFSFLALSLFGTISPLAV